MNQQTPPQGAPGPGGQPLTAEQTKAMQLIVKQALSELLQDDTAAMLVKNAQSGDPKAAVVRMVSPILNSIYATATEAGAKVDMVTVLAAGIVIIGTLAEMLVQADVLQEPEIPQFCAEVAKMAVDEHNSSLQDGSMPPDAAGGGAPPAGGMIGAAPTQGAPA